MSIFDLRQWIFITSLIIIRILMQRLYKCLFELNNSNACVTNTISLFSDCQAVSVQNAIVEPAGTVNSGSAVNLNCESGYTLDSSGRNNTTLTCTDGQYDDVTPTCNAGPYFFYHYNASSFVFYTV